MILYVIFVCESYMILYIKKAPCVLVKSYHSRAYIGGVLENERERKREREREREKSSNENSFFIVNVRKPLKSRHVTYSL